MATKNDRPVPARAIHPGEILREELRERGIRQKEFAGMIDVAPSHLNEFIKGKRDLNETLAMKLEAQLGIPYASWMNLQNGYVYDVKAIAERSDEEHAALEFEKSCSDLFNLNIVYRSLKLQALPLADRVAGLKKLAPFDLLQAGDLLQAFAGRFRHGGETRCDEKNMLAWLVLNRIGIAGARQECGTYAEGNADKAADELSKLANGNELSVDVIRKCLNRFGIMYVEVPKVEKAPVDAYSTIEGAHPVITVTYRHNDMDKLAFDILHELCHIGNHISDIRKEFISMEGASYADDDMEKEADLFAMNHLIPEETWNKIMKEGCADLSPYAIVKTVATKARKYGISPSIAVSRYKHDASWHHANSCRSPRIH